MEAGSQLYKIAVVHGYREASGIFIAALIQAVLKSEYQQMFELTIREYVKNNPVL